VRLPTRRSHGKANLHQGAMGAGLDLATGITTFGVTGNSAVAEHPDTGAPIAGLQIPRWEYLLEFAARCYELTGLGYLGVDIVLDRDKGPMLLELNARPGLNIQIANRCGLQARLGMVEVQPAGVPVRERVAFAMTALATRAPALN
ncbi:MAG: sugar-transfer associated ATP-grasp domain-containing protein, partial [Gammaproteobacteria bacterium]